MAGWICADYPTISRVMGFRLQVIVFCGLAHAHYAELVSTDAKLAERPKQASRVVWAQNNVPAKMERTVSWTAWILRVCRM